MVSMDTINSWVDEVYMNNYALLLAIVYESGKSDDYIKSNAEDIVQDVFELALEKGLVLMHHPNIRGWLIITTKHFLSKHRNTPAYLSGKKASSIDNEDALRSVHDRQLSEFTEHENALRQAQRQLDEIEESIGEENMKLLAEYYSESCNKKALARRLLLSDAALRMRVSRLCVAITEEFKKKF